MNIFTLIIAIIFGILGGGSTIAIVGYLFVVLFQKIIRKIRFGTPYILKKIVTFL